MQEKAGSEGPAQYSQGMPLVVDLLVPLFSSVFELPSAIVRTKAILLAVIVNRCRSCYAVAVIASPSVFSCYSYESLPYNDARHWKPPFKTKKYSHETAAFASGCFVSKS